MNKEKVIKELDKAFGKYKFFSEDHHYEKDKKKIGISVTTLIEEYTEEFDAEEEAKSQARKYNRNKEDILNEWKYKNEFACRKGSTCHEYVQSLWTGEHWSYDNFDFSGKYNDAVCKIKNQADQFFEDYKDKMIHIRAEQIVGSEEYDIAGSVDGLFINKETNQLILVDYKTNTYITGYNKDPYLKFFKPPLQDMIDDKLNHYKLQLSIYKYLIEKYTDLIIDKLVIIYTSEINKSYEIIEIPYLKEEVENILEWRKWE